MQTFLKTFPMNPETLILDIQYKLDELKKEIRNQKNIRNVQKRCLKREKNKIFRSIDYWISHGMITREAVELIAADLNYNPDDLAFLYARYNREKKALKKYAQRFLIKQLKKNKFKIRQIAKILNVSVRTVAYIAAEKTPDFDER